jgi:hypothetical protein
MAAWGQAHRDRVVAHLNVRDLEIARKVVDLEELLATH